MISYFHSTYQIRKYDSNYAIICFLFTSSYFITKQYRSAFFINSYECRNVSCFMRIFLVEIKPQSDWVSVALSDHFILLVQSTCITIQNAIRNGEQLANENDNIVNRTHIQKLDTTSLHVPFINGLPLINCTMLFVNLFSLRGVNVCAFIVISRFANIYL